LSLFAQLNSQKSLTAIPTKQVVAVAGAVAEAADAPTKNHLLKVAVARKNLARKKKATVAKVAVAAVTD
jgi:hypothetical protein